MAKLKGTIIEGKLVIEGSRTIDCKQSTIELQDLETETLNKCNLIGPDGIFEQTQSSTITTIAKQATHSDKVQKATNANKDSKKNDIKTTYAKLGTEPTDTTQFTESCSFNEAIQVGGTQYNQQNIKTQNNSTILFPWSKTGTVALVNDIPDYDKTPEVIYWTYAPTKMPVVTPDNKWPYKDGRQDWNYRYVWHGGTIRYYGVPITIDNETIYMVNEIESGYWGDKNTYTMRSPASNVHTLGSNCQGLVYLDVYTLTHFCFLHKKPTGMYCTTTLQAAVREYTPQQTHTIEPITSTRQLVISYARPTDTTGIEAMGCYILFDSIRDGRCGTVNYTVTSSYTLTEAEWIALREQPTKQTPYYRAYGELAK